MSRGRRTGWYGVVDAALVRASVHEGESVVGWWPALEDGAQVEAWCAWLAEVWARPAVAEAVRVASPVLAARVDQVLGGRWPSAGRVRRMVMSIARYLVRMRGRATPFGVFAGVAPLRFGSEIAAPRGVNRVVRARPDARWLGELITRLESCAEVRQRLLVMVNDLAVVRGERVVLPWVPHVDPTGHGSSPAQVSVRCGRAVDTVLRVAKSPIRVGDLIGKLAAEMPGVSAAGLDGMIAKLLACGVLISGLRPPSTSGDGLAHVLGCMSSIGTQDIEDGAPLVNELRTIHAELSTGSPDLAAGPLRWRMRALAGVVDQPVMVDCRLGGTAVLPAQVAEAAAAAADALVRASPHPAGDPHMREYHSRFVDRYGVGALVRVDELIDPTAGLGLPAHYERDDERAGLDPRVSHRDEQLLALAQQAALDRAREVEFSEDFLDLLVADASPPRPAPHIELCAEVHAPTMQSLTDGAFTLVVRGVSRSAMAMSGRFVDLLAAPDRRRMIDQYAKLPTIVESAVSAQLSFAPRNQRLQNVTFSSYLLPTTLALAEHHGQASDRIAVDDLAVTADGDRLYVVSLSRRCVVEPVVANAVARRAWPPLARLLVEIACSPAAVMCPFAWGAASCLPYLPRVRYRRSVLSSARWRIPSGALPAPAASHSTWVGALGTLREQLGLPDWVSVGDGDRLLHLDLDEPMDRALLRDHLDRASRSERSVLVTEAPTPTDHGWAGGRAHEIVIPLAAATPPAPATVTRSAALTVIGREHGVLPGEGVLSACLYGHLDHVDAILTGHLPRLLTELGQRWSDPMWWFIRYRDPRPHLRLRLRPRPELTGHAVAVVGAWAAGLRRRGLVGDLMLDTYRPETARYGPGPAMDAAEALFAADSAAACAQISALAAARHVHPRALTAASMVDLAASITGGRSAGMRWILRRRPSRTVGALGRDDVRQAGRLADPTDDYAVLRALPGGELLAKAWRARRRAAAAYVCQFQQSPAAPLPDSVLISLLHLHHIRAIGIDPEGERLVDRAARGVALAWSFCTANANGRVP